MKRGLPKPDAYFVLWQLESGRWFPLARTSRERCEQKKAIFERLTDGVFDILPEGQHPKWFSKIQAETLWKN